MPADCTCPTHGIYPYRKRILLAGLTTFIVLSPLFHGRGIGDIAIAVAGSLLVGSCTLSIPGGINPRRNSVIWGAFCLVLQIVSAVQPDSVRLANLSHLTTILLLSYVVYLVGLRILASHNVGPEQVSGGVSVYLLLALVFARGFHLLESIAPGSLRNQTSGLPASFHDVLYFSFCTVTTVGYGDIVAVTPAAKSVAMFEAIVGVFYLAILISRLTSLYDSSERISSADADSR